jgi:hypothetical protein
MDTPAQTPDPITVPCRICSKPVPLEKAFTDADGKAVHEDCLADELTKGKFRVG